MDRAVHSRQQAICCSLAVLRTGKRGSLSSHVEAAESVPIDEANMAGAQAEWAGARQYVVHPASDAECGIALRSESCPRLRTLADDQGFRSLDHSVGYAGSSATWVFPTSSEQPPGTAHLLRGTAWLCSYASFALCRSACGWLPQTDLVFHVKQSTT